MIYEYTRDFKHSLINMFQTEFADIQNISAKPNMQNALEKYFNVHDYEKTNDIQFIDACDRYFRDIVMPHKLHVLNAGLELITNSCFQNYNIDKSDFVRRLFVHDMSKFSFIEASGYVHKHFDTVDFKSPEFKLAWHHHKANNDHHSQYWYDIDKQGKLSCLDMSPIAIFEMFADFIGAGKTYGESFEEWFPKNCQNLILSEKTAGIVGHIASTLLDQSITIHRHEKISGMYIEVN